MDQHENFSDVSQVPSTSFAPVDPNTLEKLDHISSRKDEIAARLLKLEQEKVQLLRLANELDKEFSNVLLDIRTSRGIPNDVGIIIHPQTGEISPNP